MILFPWPIQQPKKMKVDIIEILHLLFMRHNHEVDDWRFYSLFLIHNQDVDEDSTVFSWYVIRM